MFSNEIFHESNKHIPRGSIAFNDHLDCRSRTTHHDFLKNVSFCFGMEFHSMADVSQRNLYVPNQVIILEPVYDL